VKTATAPAVRSAQQPLHLFEACGLEIEYMLVDASTLDVQPIADRVLQDAAIADAPVNDYLHDSFGWSNELVMHVLELKNTRPTAELGALAERLQSEVTSMNERLARHAARLMPGGMHPWMNPDAETRLWPHAHSPVYRAYDRIFNCSTHGWSNLQSTHINLPFANDEEFARLHAAARVIIPIVPALAAASPYADGRGTGILDYRMEMYRRNADAVPQLNGDIVPEAVTTRAEYERLILQPVYRAISQYDAAGVLQHEWLNARGAIARFDRNAIELRVLDTQECPRVDVAFAALIMDLAESLCDKVFRRPTRDAQLPTRMLADIFIACTHEADYARIPHPEYLRLLGVTRSVSKAGPLWETLAEQLDRENSPRSSIWRKAAELATARGPLARRLLRAVGPRPSHRALHELYKGLADALESGKPFDP
jgi:glutamate---cysteine ligase / carboxylate-amine ligase